VSRSAATVAARVWAVAGIALVFVEAAWRLAERGIITIGAGLSPAEWAALALLTAAFVYGEGMRALQRRWVPFVLARVRTLARVGSLWRVLAPLHAMALVGPDARAVTRAWLGVAGIVAAVVIVSRMPEPWRGIIDFAVAAALTWGLAALLAGAPASIRATDGDD
jgi:hypothetical protein